MRQSYKKTNGLLDQLYNLDAISFLEEMAKDEK